MKDGLFISFMDDGSTVTYTVDEVLGPLAPVVLKQLSELGERSRSPLEPCQFTTRKGLP